MSQATIRAALHTIVGAVSNVGTKHDYDRWSAKWPDFLDLFKTTISSVPQIRGYTIGWNGFVPGDQQFGAVDGIRDYRFIIRFYMGLSDADESEKTAAGIAEAIANALDDSVTLHDGQTYYYSAPATIPVFEPRVFGSVLCHYAEIHQTVSEYRA